MQKIRFLTPKWHGLLDYAAAIGLIALPALLGFQGLQLWLSVGGGIALIGYSLLTDYAFSAASLISFRAHLALDLSAAVAFVAIPLILGWGAFAMGYYFVMAAGVTVVVALSRSDSADAETPVIASAA